MRYKLAIAKKERERNKKHNYEIKRLFLFSGFFVFDERKEKKKTCMFGKHEIEEMMMNFHTGVNYSFKVT